MVFWKRTLGVRPPLCLLRYGRGDDGYRRRSNYSFAPSRHLALIVAHGFFSTPASYIFVSAFQTMYALSSTCATIFLHPHQTRYLLSRVSTAMKYPSTRLSVGTSILPMSTQAA